MNIIVIEEALPLEEQQLIQPTVSTLYCIYSITEVIQTLISDITDQELVLL